MTLLNKKVKIFYEKDVLSPQTPVSEFSRELEPIRDISIYIIYQRKNCLRFLKFIFRERGKEGEREG